MLSMAQLRVGSTKLANASEYVVRKATDLNKWYTKVIGLSEVYEFQERVVNVQKSLLQAQEKRRVLGKDLAELRKRSVQLQEQLHKINRQNDLQRFLDLMKEETEVLKEEQHLVQMFNLYDKEERERFTDFTNAIRDSHEIQRTQTEYSKYLSVCFSILGAFLAFLYSTLRRENVKPYIVDLQESHTKLQREVFTLIDELRVLSNRPVPKVSLPQFVAPPAPKENYTNVMILGASTLAALVILRAVF